MKYIGVVMVVAYGRKDDMNYSWLTLSAGEPVRRQTAILLIQCTYVAQTLVKMFEGWNSSQTKETPNQTLDDLSRECQS